MTREEQRRELFALRAAWQMAGTLLAGIANDASLVACALVFDEWRADMEYPQGTLLRHAEGLYRVQQAHTSQAHQPPDGAGMLAVYAPVQVPIEDGQVLPWISGEAGIEPGDKREHDGIVYECVQAPGVNTWAPPTVPALWKATED